jgi:23S rRNA (cytosine1962-C5)-methyltransferase
MLSKPIAVRVSKSALKSIKNNHPWVFDNSIVSMSHEGSPGDIAVVFDEKNRFVAAGLYDPFSIIRIKILQFKTPAKIDRNWFKEKIENAFMIRQAIGFEKTDGYRLIYGENDGFPGLIADLYNRNIVIKIYSLSWINYLPLLSQLFVEVFEPERIVLRFSRECAKKSEYLKGFKDGSIFFGEKLSGPVTFCENGIFFESDLQKGQKTGFFLDQRDNRKRVEELSENKSVLNVFSYSGGFSLYAARGGALEVTNIDISPYAVEAVTRNINLNKSDKKIMSCKYKNLTGDAFDTMEMLIEHGKKFDVIIIDPPSFAKSSKNRKNALNAYKKLVRLGLKLVEKRGVLVMASCSSRITSKEFAVLIDNTAKSEKKEIEIFNITAHPPDHPVKIMEGSYLKCVFCQLK